MGDKGSGPRGRRIRALEPMYPGIGTDVSGDWTRRIRGLDRTYPGFGTDGSRLRDWAGTIM